MVQRPEKRVLTGADLKAFYKAMANPVRRDILSYLGKHGEANSTSVARSNGCFATVMPSRSALEASSNSSTIDSKARAEASAVLA